MWHKSQRIFWKKPLILISYLAKNPLSCRSNVTFLCVSPRDSEWLPVSAFICLQSVVYSLLHRTRLNFYGLQEYTSQAKDTGRMKLIVSQEYIPQVFNHPPELHIICSLNEVQFPFLIFFLCSK